MTSVPHSGAKSTWVPGSEERRAYWRALSERRRRCPEYRAKQSAIYKAWRARNPITDEERARGAENQRRYRADHSLKEHHDARRSVRNALLRGDLVKGVCEVCSATRVDAHHDDYSRPLDVRWLCRAHHMEVHNELRAKATAGETRNAEPIHRLDGDEG